MSSYIVVELDTTAPQISWGLPSSSQQGTTLVIPYSINEPEIEWARLRDTNGTLTAATFDGYNITVDIPSDAALGNAWIEAQVIDELDNAALRQYLFTITPFGVVIAPGPGGGGQRFTYGAGAPAFLKDTVSISGEVVLFRLKKVSINATVELNRAARRNFSGTISMKRIYSVQFECSRAPAEHYLNLRREDEEILLLL